jgi:hypothetical protein
MKALLPLLFPLLLTAPVMAQVPPDTCAVAVINLLDQVALRVALKHGEAEVSYPEPLYPGEHMTIKVPCNSDVPVQLFVQNTMVQADFKTATLEVPEPGQIRAWCLGERCAELKARAEGTPLKIT